MKENQQVETRKYYILKITFSQKGRDGNQVFMSKYAQGYDKWCVDIDDAKLYVKLDSIKRLIKKLEPEYNPEILYATMTIETLSDIAEKHLLNT